MHRPRRDAVDRDVLPADGGAILLLTLVVLALIAALLVQVRIAASLAARHAEASLLRDRLSHAAAVAARDAMRRLALPDGAIPGTNDLLKSSWEISDPTGISSAVRVTDENRFFDLNNLAVAATGNPAARSAVDMVMDLMTLCGDFTSVARAEALLDWIDEDDEGLYESNLYARREPPYPALNRVLYGMQELLSVEGFDRELFNRQAYGGRTDLFRAQLTDCVTILPRPRSAPVPVNVNTASRPVLLAVLGLEEDKAVDGILAMRSARPLPTPDKALVLVGPALRESLRPYLDVQSHFYRIEVHSFADGQSVDLRVLVYRSPEGRVETIQWVM